MSWYQVEETHKLEGEVHIQGSKNSALPILIGAVLGSGLSIIRNCPNISDIKNLIDIIKELGVRIEYEQEKYGLTITVFSMPTLEKTDVNINKLRASILLLSVLLVKNGKASLNSPGGCNIGKRPINLHIDAMKTLGAEIEEQDGLLWGQAGRLKGHDIIFPRKSVGATENAILGAVMAKGKTRIYNGAWEPEILELITFLKKMGANIKILGPGKYVIEGVDKLYGTEYYVGGDRIAAATYMTAVGICGGQIVLNGFDYNTCTNIISLYERAGIHSELISKNSIKVSRREALKHLDIVRTAEYPGIPTDVQPFICVLMSFCSEPTIIIEDIFENRLSAGKEFGKSGAKAVTIDDRIIVVAKGERMEGCQMLGKDLRGTAALLIGAMGLKGSSCIYGDEYIKRGYEKLEENLAGLGGRVRLINDVCED